MTIEQYISSVNSRFEQGNATEHTFRGDLQQLLESLMPQFRATNEPKRQACGAPDFIITKKETPVGFIEAKNIGDNDLDGQKKNGNKEQFDRYKSSLENIIFTDYLNFHYYKDAVLVMKVSVGQVEGSRIIPLRENFQSFELLLKEFCSYTGQTIKSPKKLAEMMAGKARLLANVIEKSLNADDEQEENSSLKAQFKGFQMVLIHDIKNSEFADMYAQTIAYGMFAARLYDPNLETFSRQEAAELIPKSNPFLRKLFSYIAGVDIDDRIRWIVDSLADLFLACDVGAILKDFGKATKTEDPIIHFYETFLAAYDPKLRKARGVWYTPHPVVSFIVRSIDHILKTDFNLPMGLADNSKTKITIPAYGQSSKGRELEVHRVQMLDPATGTATFLVEFIKLIYKYFEGQQGLWNDYVEKHLIPRLNGFELLMASYAMAHLKLDLILKETGFTATKSQRLKVYLTNSLEPPKTELINLFMAQWLSQEANEADVIKKEIPVMVVAGNPPYSGESANKGEWIMSLMEDYKLEPGGKEKLKEKNPKWINDDYVKFIRYGQHFIEKNGSGILAYINPHGFLDNPTFRGMRWNLLKTFDKIYTLDLHGNSKKKETAPDGSKDENVFDIMQGVSINIFVKTGMKKPNELGKVFHFDLFGKRDFKYDFLIENSLKTVDYKELPNVKPNYFFVDKDFEQQKAYEKGFKINELLPVNSVGIVTARDSFTIQHSKAEVRKIIEQFLKLDDETARRKFNLGKDVRDWQVNYARKDLQNSFPDKGNFCQVSYRPFDNRWTFYTGKSKGFHCYPRNEVMQHFLRGTNIGLVYKLGNAEDNSASIMVTKNIIDFRSWSRPGMQGGDYISPLYIYKKEQPSSLPFTARENSLFYGNSDLENEQLSLLEEPQFAYQSMPFRPNLNQKIVRGIEKTLGIPFVVQHFKNGNNQFGELDLLDYVYAVLYSPSYREKYKAFLKIDFPRAPYPANQESFWQLVELGGEIRQLHLLESPKVDKFITTYPISGSNEITRKMTTANPGFELINASNQTGKVWVNDVQYFDGVPQKAWEFYIGGYQPAQKWLKDRNGRILGFEDILHYQKIIVALTETGRIMKEIDRIEIE